MVFLLSQYDNYGSDNDFGNGPYGYPYGDYPYTPKKSLFSKIKDYFLCDRYVKLSATVTVIGLAIILYQLAAMVYSYLLRGVPPILDRYTNDYMFATVIEMTYTVCCVGGSFAVGYILMKKMGLTDRALPFGTPYCVSDSVLVIVAGLGICFAGNIVTNFFVTSMSSLGFEFYSYNYALTAPVNLPQNAFEFICMMVHTAVLPAVFEEFAFRGVIMQPLRKYGDYFAITVSAVAFGLIHGNMTQMPFAIIAGIVLGYSSIVTGSMWTGVIIHFFNNFLSLLNSFARESLSEAGVMLFSLITVYGTIIVGAAALGMYVYKNPHFLRLRRGNYGKHKKSRLLLTVLLVPSMTIALIWMLSALFQDIYFK